MTKCPKCGTELKRMRPANNMNFAGFYCPNCGYDDEEADRRDDEKSLKN
jgi:predicted RNA-binding Zn-ribbon protein involved in translation (DUF1610 family)